MPVDHPLVPVAHGAGPQERRIRAGDLGLGHGEERAHVAGDERAEEAALLVVRPEQVEDLRVARVRRLAAEHELRVRRAADLLVEARVVEEPEPRASRVRRHVRRPQAGVARASAQLVEERRGSVVLAPDRGLVRIDVLLHEGAVAVARLEVLGREDRRHDPGRIVGCGSACNWDTTTR